MTTHICTCGDCGRAPYDDHCRFEGESNDLAAVLHMISETSIEVPSVVRQTARRALERRTDGRTAWEAENGTSLL